MDAAAAAAAAGTAAGPAAAAALLAARPALRALRLAPAPAEPGAEADRGLRALGGAVAAHEALRALDAGGCCLTDFGAREGGLRALLAGARASRSLEALDLSENDLGASGAELAAAELAGAASLRTLRLAGNRVQAAGAAALAALLEGPGDPADPRANRIRELDLRDNDLTTGGADASGLEALAAALRAPPPAPASASASFRDESAGLWALDLRANALACADVVIWAQVLRDNARLARLHLDAPVCECKTPHADALAVIGERLRANEAAARALHARSSADPDAGDPGSLAPAIRMAVRSGAIAALKTLLAVADADSLAERSPRSRQTAMHCAVLSRDGDALSALLDHDAPVNAFDGKGQTPLHLAASQDDIALALLLVHHGASVFLKNAQGKLPGELFYQDWMRLEVSNAAGQLDALVVTGTDPADARFAVRLVDRLGVHHGFRVAFATQTDADALRLLEKGDIRASVVIALASGASVRSKHFASLVQRARQSATLSTSGLAPLLVVDCDPALVAASACAERDPVFDGARSFDLTAWAAASLSHWHQVESRRDATPADAEDLASQPTASSEPASQHPHAPRAAALRAASKRRFRPTLLQTLETRWPEPSGASERGFREMTVHFRALIDRAHKETSSRLAAELHRERFHLELERLRAAQAPFVAIVYADGVASARRGAQLAAQELRTAGLQTWTCPLPAGLHDGVLQDGIRHARALVVVRDSANEGSAAVERGLDGLADEASTLKKPVVPVLVHKGQCFMQFSGPGLAVQLAGLDAELAPHFARVHTVLDVLEARQEVASARRALAIRQDLCLDLRRQAARYEARFRRALEIMGPVINLVPTSSPRSRLRRLEQESLRLQHAGPREADEIDVAATLDASVADLLGISEGARIPLGELREKLVSALEAARWEHAAVRIQAVWRGCFARELRRRAARHAAASRIQRCFRRFRLRSIAWALQPC